MKIGIIEIASYFKNDDGKIFLPAHEAKSLEQWFAIFDNVTLFLSETNISTKSDDWLPLNPKVEIVRLCGRFDSWYRKYRQIKRIVNNLPNHYDYFYYRLPSVEATFFYMLLPKDVKYFVELHGDMEQSIMASSKPWIVRKIMSRWFYNIYCKMSSKGNFALSIGKALKDKYVKTDIPCYVTTNHLLPEKDYPEKCPYHPLSSEHKILFVGHIHKRKGLITLFEVLNRMHQEKFKFKMLLAGTGDLRDTLENYAEQNGFNRNIYFLGQVAHGKELFQLYREADLFVLPSIASEGVPRVTHEAMVFGCPVVATDIGSVKWQLEGGAGIVVPPGDVDELYKAIMNVFTNSELRKQLIETGFDKSCQYTLEAQAAGIQKFVTQQMKI